MVRSQAERTLRLRLRLKKFRADGEIIIQAKAYPHKLVKK